MTRRYRRLDRGVDLKPSGTNLPTIVRKEIDDVHRLASLAKLFA